MRDIAIPWDHLSEEEKQKSIMAAWQPSSVSKEKLERMVKEGILPAQELIGWRSAYGEVVPMPHTGEAVIFTDFFERGFSLPPHPFLRGLLCFYGLELHHLNPNSFLQITSFTAAYEAFVGILMRTGVPDLPSRGIIMIGGGLDVDEPASDQH